MGERARRHSLVLDAGAISIASTGYQEITWYYFMLNPGVYGLAFLPDTAVTVVPSPTPAYRGSPTFF